MAVESDVLRPAVFLDKDGTLIENLPYNVDPGRIKLAPGAAEALTMLGKLNVPLVIVSNQPGVALGLFKRAELNAVRDRLHELFERHGAKLAGFYCCPHHPTGRVPEYAYACACRKPGPGMLLDAALDLSIDLAQSWMVGDILNDVEAGRRVGCTTVLIDNGNETEWITDSPLREPHHTVPDMAHAAELIASSFREAPIPNARIAPRQHFMERVLICGENR